MNEDNTYCAYGRCPKSAQCKRNIRFHWDDFDDMPDNLWMIVPDEIPCDEYQPLTPQENG